MKRGFYLKIRFFMCRNDEMMETHWNEQQNQLHVFNIHMPPFYHCI